PAGRLMNDQAYVSGSLSASDEPLPSRVTVVDTLTAWLAPAFATGGVFVVVMVTVDGALFRYPLLTISCATYVPGKSATKVGFAISELFRWAAEPAGRVSRLQRYVSGFPSTSEEAAPFNCTSDPSATIWFGPALATGGVFCVVIVTFEGKLFTFPSFTTSC